MALIFSDSGFGAAVFVAMVVGILFGGIALALSRSDAARERGGGFVSALAVGIKASAIVPLPFMLLGARDKLKMFGGMLTAADHKVRMDQRFYLDDIDAGMRSAERLGGNDLLIARARAAVIKKAGAPY